MTTNLRELQADLQAYLLTGNAAAIAPNIIDPETDEKITRLAIYHDSYYLCLSTRLAEKFTLLEKILGAAAFEALSLAYINAYPSQYFNINDFGQDLPGFLRAQAPYKQQLYLSELAELIWAFANILVTADATVLSVNDLAGIPQDRWGQLQLTTHPSVQLLTQQTNTYFIWQALQQDKSLPSVVESAGLNYCLVWRNVLMPYSCLITQEAAWMLQALQAQQTFADICEGLTEWLPAEAVAQYAVNCLINWLNQGIISTIKY